MSDDSIEGSIDGSSDGPDRRAIGLRRMKEVYGWDMASVDGEFVELTVDHLFGRVWEKDVFTIRERRLMLIGLLVGRELSDVVGLQLDAALRLGELSAEELREIVVFLTHYAGWPSGAKLNSQVEELIARSVKAASKPAPPEADAGGA